MTAQLDAFRDPVPPLGPAPIPRRLDLTADVAQRLERRSAEIDRLVPLARELLHAAKQHGVTVAHLRAQAVRRGLLTGGESGRTLSYLSQVFRRAGARPTERVERTKSRNRNVTWVLTETAT